MRKIDTNDEMMTTREAGEVLGVALRTVQLWVESGVLPAWRTAGGHRRISRHAVNALLAERAQAMAAVHSAGQRVAAHDQPIRLLLVEDDPNLLRLYALMVEGWDFSVELTIARNGFEGLLRMGQMRPDLVVTDLNMPGMDGFEMLRAIKMPGSGFEDLCVVVVSALALTDIAARGGLPAGVRFFQKPVPFKQLEAVVREQLCAETVPASLVV